MSAFDEDPKTRSWTGSLIQQAGEAFVLAVAAHHFQSLTRAGKIDEAVAWREAVAEDFPEEVRRWPGPVGPRK